VVDGLYLLFDGSLLFYNLAFRSAYFMPTVVKNLKIYCDDDDDGEENGDDDYYYYKASTYNLQLSVICNNFYG
jgi:hypothetical protein